MYKIKPVLYGEHPSVEITEAFCDICGENCMTPFKDFVGMILVSYWGYSSKKDGEEWRACVCERCADKHLKNLIKFKKI